MANKVINSRMQQKHDTAANWALATTFIPMAGEIIIYSDLNKFKIGDGENYLADLPFSASETIVDVAELPELEEADQSVLYRVPETETHYEGTTVPNTGTVTELHMNMNSDIKDVISKVTLTPLGSAKGYCLILTEEGSYIMLYSSFGGSEFGIDAEVDSEYTNLYLSGGGGWQVTEEELSTILSKFYNKQLVSSFEGLSVGADNANINGFFSLTEPQEVTNPVSYKYYSANNLGWTNLNNQLEKIATVGAVPNSGHVDNVIFDTTMSIEDVVALCSTLTQWETYSGIQTYAISCDKSYNSITINKEISSSLYTITHSGMSFDNELFNSTDGWAQDFTGVVEVNAELLANVDGSSVGEENSKISDLCWTIIGKYVIKEFDGNTKDIITSLKVNGKNAIKNNEVNLNIGFPITEEGSTGGEAVPNTGTGSTYYFNINMQPTEVNAILDELVAGKEEPIYFFALNFAEMKYIRAYVNEGSYSIYDSNTVELYFYSESSPQGWRSGFDGYTSVMEGVELADNFYGYQVGQKNADIVDLFCTAQIPFHYYLDKSDGTRSEICYNKAIIGTDATINDTTAIAVGYSELDQYEAIWDGDTSGKDSKTIGIQTFYKISDLTPTYNNLLGATAVYKTDYDETTCILADYNITDDLTNAGMIKVRITGHDYNSFLVVHDSTKAQTNYTGIYAWRRYSYNYAKSLSYSIETAVHKIPAKYVDIVAPEVQDMTGATASTAGTHGLAPAPAAGSQGKVLRGNGAWGDILIVNYTQPTGQIAGDMWYEVTNYSISYNLTHCTGSASNPTVINKNSTATLLFTADDNYQLPNNVTVTGASYTWNKSTGELILSNPTNNVVITIAAEYITYNVTWNLTNCTAGSTPSTIAKSDIISTTITPASGYNLPATVTVTNADCYYDQPSGEFEISNPTGDVTITITATASTTYNVTWDMNLCTSSSMPSTIRPSDDLYFTITPDSGCAVYDVNVTGASKEWDEVSQLRVYGATGDVSIQCLADYRYTVNWNLTNCDSSPKPTALWSDDYLEITVTPYSGYTLPEEITVTNAYYEWEPEYEEEQLQLASPTGPVTITITAEQPGPSVYNVTWNLTNCTSDSTPSTITEEDDLYFTITPSEGYALPEEITVTGAQYSWEKSENYLNIWEATSDVIITITGVPPATYNITWNLTNCTSDSTPSTITEEDDLYFTITPSEGYALPEEITVTGAQYSWDTSSNELNIWEATSDVIITITGVPAATYNITWNLTNCDSEPKPLTIFERRNLYCTITPSEGYVLPEDISVSGLGGYDWYPEDEEDQLYIEYPTGPVTITITAEAQ